MTEHHPMLTTEKGAGMDEDATTDEPVDVDLYFTLRSRLRLPAWAALAVARTLDDDTIDLIYDEAERGAP